jgi:hypothetical protein
MILYANLLDLCAIRLLLMILYANLLDLYANLYWIFKLNFWNDLAFLTENYDQFS